VDSNSEQSVKASHKKEITGLLDGKKKKRKKNPLLSGLTEDLDSYGPARDPPRERKRRRPEEDLKVKMGKE